MLFCRVLTASGFSALILFQLTVTVSSKNQHWVPLIRYQGSLEFVNRMFPLNIVYFKDMEVTYVMDIRFTNVNLLTSQIKIYTKDAGGYSELRTISGSQPGTIKVSIHSKDQALVIVTTGSGTFSMNYEYRATCRQYCGYDGYRLVSNIACGTLSDAHAIACIECKRDRCRVPALVLPDPYEPPEPFGGVICWAYRFGYESCLVTENLHLSCQVRCDHGYIPRNNDPPTLATECRPKNQSAVPTFMEPVEGYWTNNATEYCLTLKEYVNICLSSDINLSRTCNYNETAASIEFDSESFERILSPSFEPDERSEVPRKCSRFCRKKMGGRRGFKVDCAGLRKIGARRRCRECQEHPSCLQ